MMRFICNRCGGHRLEEVMVDVTQSTEIIGIHDEVKAPQYGNQSNEDGKVERYQCMECGLALMDGGCVTISSDEGLYEWLKEHGMLDGEDKG